MANRFEILEQYPAYHAVTFAKGVEPCVYDGETLTDAKHLENWQLGSVVGFALRNGDNPITKYNDAIARGHETHWANNMGACLTDDKKRHYGIRIVVNYGDIIIFHGTKFRIEKAPNHNINLIEVK